MMGVPEEGQDLAALAANQSPVRFTWLATGLMMIRLDVFDSMTQPFFYHPADPESGYAGGEDLQFCAALREAGCRSTASCILSESGISSRACCGTTRQTSSRSNSTTN